MLIQFDEASLEFADRRILQAASWVLEPKARVALVGRNGAGKSTLMRIITGEQQLDAGEVRYRDHLRVAKLQQELPTELDRTVEAVVTEGLADIEQNIQAFQRLSEQEPNEQTLALMAKLQRDIETHGGWHLSQRVETMMTQLGLPQGKRLRELSGGWRRRVLLGKALVGEPDVLLLDEPTNHLDIATIEWLEHCIRSYPGAVVFVTHDRYFLQKLATSILEIDRGALREFPGNYDRYLDLKAQLLETEREQNALFDKKLAGEEAWIRQGVKARRTRNMGRVRALEAMREEAAQRIKPQGKARVAVQNADQSARKVIQANSVNHQFGDQCLVKQFNIKILRGDRIGLIGNNGLGKSTLLKILLGELSPDSGTVKLGENLEIAYFDQTRRALELDKSVAYNVAQGKDYLTVNGKDRHVIGYLKSFLFEPERSMTPVSLLSGGERNRVLLAKLFAKPSNVMVLDEPTNDLDVEMLEVLEEQLMAYTGTLLLVSHDRQFLDNVVTSTLVFEGDGQVNRYVGGFSDWLRQGKGLATMDKPVASRSDKALEPNPPESKAPATKRKLSYKEQRELDQLPEEIAQLEAVIGQLQEQVAREGFYQQPHEIVSEALETLAQKEAILDEKMARWLELDE